MRLISLLNKIVIYFFLTSSNLVGNDAFTYVYLLPFDNIQNDPALDWISSGLSDMVREELKSVYGVRIKSREDLEVIMKNPANPYTVALLACSVSNFDGFKFIPGRAPDPTNRSEGCPFVTRCEKAKQICSVSRPRLKMVMNRMVACHFPVIDEETC